MNSIALALHLLAAIFWIGGIFYSYVILRPASTQLEPPARLKLWDTVFSRFFIWVWLLIAVLLLSGYLDLFVRFGGFSAPGYLHAMQLIGWVMILLFAWLYFVPFKRLRTAVAAAHWTDAAAAMNPIRQVMAVNLGLGVVISVVGVAGPYFS